MKETLKQIPKTMVKALTPKQKVLKLMTYIGGGWYMEKVLKDYLRYRDQNYVENQDKFQKTR